MYLKKNYSIFFYGAFACTQLLAGCFTLTKYPSSWPDKQPVTTPAQLSGIYDSGVLQILDDFLEFSSSLDSYSVQLLINDSFQYGIKPVTLETTGNTSEINIDYSQKMDKKYVKKSFSTKRGLQLSYHPNIGGQGTPLGTLRNYIFLYKDTEGNLIIRRGQRCYGLVWLFFPVIENKYEWISVGKNFIKYSFYRLKPIYSE